MASQQRDPQGLGGSPRFAINLWQPWAQLVCRGIKTIENRSWPASWLDRYGGLPVRVWVHAAQRVDLAGFMVSAEILGIPTSELYWTPWASGAIVGEVTIAAVLSSKPTGLAASKNMGIVARHLAGASYLDDVAPWGMPDSTWFLLKDPVEYRVPVPWKSRQSILVEPDRGTVEKLQQAVPGRATWAGVTTHRKHLNIGEAPADPSSIVLDASGFRCTVCGERWNRDGSELGARPRFTHRVLPHDYRYTPLVNPDWVSERNSR